MSRRAAVLLSALILGGGAGCERAPTLDPPDIDFGQALCSVCGMIISDDRFAAALVVIGERDAYEKHAFDDIGCMFDKEASLPSHAVAARYVPDFDRRQWLPAETAAYVHSGKLHSPMAFGVAACADEAAAQALLEEYPGDLLDFTSVRRRHADGELRIRLRPTREQP